MSVARVVEITSTSTTSFEDAIQCGIARATRTLGDVRSAWVKEEQMDVEKGQIVAYTVTLMISIVIEDAPEK